MAGLLGEAGAKEAQTASTTAAACSTGGTLSFTTCYGDTALLAAALPGMSSLGNKLALSWDRSVMSNLCLWPEQGTGKSGLILASVHKHP